MKDAIIIAGIMKTMRLFSMDSVLDCWHTLLCHLTY